MVLRWSSSGHTVELLVCPRIWCLRSLIYSHRGGHLEMVLLLLTGPTFQKIIYTALLLGLWGWNLSLCQVNLHCCYSVVILPVSLGQKHWNKCQLSTPIRQLAEVAGSCRYLMLIIQLLLQLLVTDIYSRLNLACPFCSDLPYTKIQRLCRLLYGSNIDVWLVSDNQWF